MKKSHQFNRQAVIYARVSSDEQEKEGFSIPAQTKLLKDYAVREGFHVIEEYVDVETAKKPGRPGFNNMVAYFAKESRLKGKVDRCRVLLVYITIDDSRSRPTRTPPRNWPVEVVREVPEDFQTLSER